MPKKTDTEPKKTPLQELAERLENMKPGQTRPFDRAAIEKMLRADRSEYYRRRNGRLKGRL